MIFSKMQINVLEYVLQIYTVYIYIYYFSVSQNVMFNSMCYLKILLVFVKFTSFTFLHC